MHAVSYDRFTLFSDQLNELTGSLIGPPGPPGRSKPGRPGPVGLQGPSGTSSICLNQVLYYIVNYKKSKHNSLNKYLKLEGRIQCDLPYRITSQT